MPKMLLKLFLIGKALLFPLQPRTFQGLRWLTVALRSAHLVGITGFAGGLLHHIAIAQLHYFWLLTLTSGFALIGIEMSVSGRWLIEMRGVIILLKLLCLGLFLHITLMQEAMIYFTLLLSAVIAHAPAKVRHYSPFRAREP